MTDKDENVSDTPKGVVATFTDEHGRVIASTSDFNRDRPGGFKTIEVQRRRARLSLAWKVIDAYAGPMLARAIPEYDRGEIIQRLVREHGCTVTFIPVGYADEEISIL